MRVLLLTGKGGVGKTSLAAATALGAAAHGHRVALLSTDPAHSLGDALEQPIGPQLVEIAPGVSAREVSALAELDRSWSEIQHFLRRVLRDDADPVIADELLVFPGLEELVALRAIREAEAAGHFDVCVVDCAPTGSTLRMLRFPDALRLFMERFFEMKRRGARLLRPVAARLHAGDWVPSEALFDAFERLVGDVDDVRRLLLNTAACSARLVLNPARVVVAETRRSFAYLSLYGVATDAVLINRVLPAEAQSGYFARWAAHERQALRRIGESFPIPQLRAPLYAREPRGVPALTALSRQLYGARDPAGRFHAGRPVRWRKHAGRTRLEVDLPGAQGSLPSVLARGRDLFVTVRDATRMLALPDSVAGRPVQRARLRGDVLEVDFA
ncbi:MAG: TRC40/GET3/ArsA family transport-energizing ATPase [Deltaproteobacteria bacterium]|nr:TRC40/GET3/ArsA family transport-energizing ATPase [Deltaproteobacteria bacterium]